MKITGLYEKLGLTEEQVEELRKKKLEGAVEQLRRFGMLVSTGQQPGHGNNKKATAKRRRLAKLARKSRRGNRG